MARSIVEDTPNRRYSPSATVRTAAAACGLDVFRTDESRGPSLIMSDIVEHPFEGGAVCAEPTGARFNVFHDTNVAHVIQNKHLLICDRQDLGWVPFDVVSNRVMAYSTAGTGPEPPREAIETEILDRAPWCPTPAQDPGPGHGGSCVEFGATDAGPYPVPAISSSIDPRD